MSQINWLDPKSQVSEHFTVGEVTQGDDRRIPLVGSEEEINIITLAQELDKVREAWGSPIGVTSWYRPYEVNLAVGGVSNSRHIYGSAADIYTMDGRDQEFETWLDNVWGGALGYGAASGKGFTHLDLREGGFKEGSYQLRWNY
jgi:hypothetical protein